MIRNQADSAARILAGGLPRRSAVAALAAGVAAVAGVGRSRTRAVQQATPSPDASAFIVIRRYQLLPDAAMDELVARVTDGFVPIVEQIPGFQEYLFVDAGEGAHLTMSLYDDPSGAEQSTRDAAAWAAANVVEMIVGPPDVTEGWVRIHVDADDPGDATPAA
ncbi:MAG: hypothetical protein M3Q50_07350 [Chloroflexota bacterium]|nr:hypothetical protein [Chloroflexota bacterium]